MERLLVQSGQKAGTGTGTSPGMPFQMAQSVSEPWRGELNFEKVRVE